MSKYFPLTVKEIRPETDECVSVAFEIPEALKDEFTFLQGQHISLKKMVNGTELRRSYSICSSPLENELRIAVKAVPYGKFSEFVNQNLKVGDVLEVFPPRGKFHTPADPTAERLYVAFVAGSGITPVISLIKTALLEEPESRFILFYGNRSSESIIFREALEDLKNKFLGRFSIHYLLSKENPGNPLFAGRIGAEKLKAFSSIFFEPEEVFAFFLCGPEQMIFGMQDKLQEMGVPKDRIHFELFTSPDAKAFTRTTTAKKQDFDPAEKSKVTVILDGATTKFTMPYGEGNILDSAIHSGADAPYSCKGGVCCTCKAKLEEGKVDMDRVFGLEQDEIDDGYILTCQSQPRSESITVNFDLR